ncbi:MAG TPA: L-histidine N(alpha)-methyltransferase [Acidobacteriaceae bacterium]
MSTQVSIDPLELPLNIATPESALRGTILHEVLHGLDVPVGTQKSLPPWLFYDERGTELFQEITRLPEYYLTRTERDIFAARGDEILSRAGSPLTVVELGSGTAAKTGLLLSAALRRQAEVLYQPIDVSPTALDEAASALSSAIPGVTVRPQVANYITEDYRIERPKGCCILALYIGSSIGNFSLPDAKSILHKLRDHLSTSGDALLLGVDLAPSCIKTVELLLAAYDDSAGVTAAFNKNILARLNRELEANFDLDRFAHRVCWNAEESRIEMHLESLAAQTVLIDGHRIDFAAGETIHTENSYKFTERSLVALIKDAGFGAPQWFQDPQHYFAVALAYPGSAARFYRRRYSPLLPPVFDSSTISRMRMPLSSALVMS